MIQFHINYERVFFMKIQDSKQYANSGWKFVKKSVKQSCPTSTNLFEQMKPQMEQSCEQDGKIHPKIGLKKGRKAEGEGPLRKSAWTCQGT